jgi:small subunit ribosomal protein S20
MANIKSAEKRARSSAKRRGWNRAAKSATSTAQGRFVDAVGAGDRPLAEKLFRQYCSVLDKAARTGRIKKGNADRHKSRAAHRLASLKPAAAPAA